MCNSVFFFPKTEFSWIYLILKRHKLSCLLGFFFFFDKSAFCRYQLTSPQLPSFIKKHIACNSQGLPHFRSHIFSNTTEYPGLLVKYEFSFHWWEKWSNREENKQIQSKDRARSFNLNSPLLEYVITFSLSFVQPTPSTQICPLTWYFSFYHMPFKPQEQIRHKFLKHEFSTNKCLQNAHITNSIDSESYSNGRAKSLISQCINWWTFLILFYISFSICVSIYTFPEKYKAFKSAFQCQSFFWQV